MKKDKVLVIGSAVVDVRIPVSHIPERSEDLNVYSQSLSLGGCAFNVCDCLRRFSVPFTAFLPLGKGFYGAFARQRMQERGIVSALPEAEGESGCCYCFVEPDGERTFICYHGAEYLFRAEWFEELERSGAADEIGAVYICGLEIEERTGSCIIDFLERHPDYEIYFAPSSRICMIDPEKMRRLFKLSPVLHLNTMEAISYTESEAFRKAGGHLPDTHTDDFRLAASCLHELTGNTVLVTMGKSGAYILDGSGEFQVPAVKVEKVADTIGAGDSHIGTYIAMRQKGMDIPGAVMEANRQASLVVQQEGALL